MAEPLLNLAPKTDVTPAAVRMDAMSSKNQSLSDEPHPFAQVLAGQSASDGEVATVAEVPVEGGASGKPAGQTLPADGKELPDASRLLELGGLPLQPLDSAPAQTVEAEADGTFEPAPGTPGLADAELPDTDTAAELATETLVTDAAETPPADVPVAGPAVAQAATAQHAVADAASGEAVTRDLTGRAGIPDAVTGAKVMANPQAAGEVDPDLPLPAQESARTVSVAVHQALQARTGDKEQDGRFGDLIRTVATAQAGGEGGARPEQAVATGVPGSASTGNPPASAQLPTTTVAVPVRQAGWDQALGDQVQWMVGQKLQGAEIRLNPAHLGPMEVRIQVQHDQASITFSAQHGVVRDALEAAIPRLRDMLSDSGLNLASVQVSDQSLAEQRSQGHGQSFAGQRGLAAGEGGEHEEAPVTLVTPLRAASGSIDYFA